MSTDMKPVLLDGLAFSKIIKQRVKTDITATGVTPGLAVVLVGDDQASAVYVAAKKKDCEACGIRSFAHNLPAETTQVALLALIGELNADPDVHGILVQLPLPSHINPDAVICAIDPRKDVDAFHPENVGLICAGKPRFLPCTPGGIMRLLDTYAIDVMGKHCVVVGASDIVGKPMALCLLARHATVTVCHKHTVDLPKHTREADVLIVATGCRGLITAEFVKPGAAVVDVGITRGEDGKLYGDVLFDDVAPLCTHITPVPGGVGPMTRAVLMENTLRAIDNEQWTAYNEQIAAMISS